jgi:Na+/proline symporter
MNSKSFEERVEVFGKNIDMSVRTWVRNDRSLNFLRTTSARLILSALTVAVLYGLPAFQMFYRGVSIWIYVGAFVSCILLQKLSIRFAFDDDSQIDEYQQERRNRAYRRAYKRVATILTLAIILVTANGYSLKHSLGSGFSYSFDLGSENWVFLGVFVCGLFVVQKYLSWGIKGEARTE